MITEHYPNPNVKIVEPVKVVYNPPVVIGGKDSDMMNGHGVNFNTHWAKKTNLALSAFVQRDYAVQQAARGVLFAKNAQVYPVDADEYKKLGACRILDVARSYRDFFDWDWEWDEKGPLYIIEAYSEKNKFSVFRATAGFFQTVPPVYDLETKK